MIRSFLKRVFSSTSEVSASSEQQTMDQIENEQPLGLPNDLPKMVQELDIVKSCEVAKISKDWIERHSFREIEAAVERLYENAQEEIQAGYQRLRLELDETLQIPDSLMAKRISKYLINAEQEIVDFTFFLDKNDPETMEIYKTYLLPQHVEDINSFLQERCFMIYETSIGLSHDYRLEIEHLLQALDISTGPDFFQEFDKWREEILKKHREEENERILDSETSPVSSDLVMIKVSREEVENENIQQLDHYLKEALQSPEMAKSYKETLLFSFYGFSKHEDLYKLMNRKEVNDWASLLVEKHPYIFYFLNDEEYPMTSFLTSLVVTTEMENQEVFYNEEELLAFQEYILDALKKLASWLEEDIEEVLFKFECHFQ